MDIISLMKTKQEILAANLKILIDHPVTKGEHCEGAWIDFFRSFLPNKYAVDKGFVFDSKGNVSEQIDIIIYDALYAPLVFGTDAGEKFVTAESVYAIFESKPKVDKETFAYANKKVESVTTLHRSARSVYVAGKVEGPRKLTKIIGGILAVDSVEPDSIKEYAKACMSVDMGCAINKHTFHICRDTDNNFQSMIVSDKEEIVLSFFYLILNELYKLGTVAGIDIRDYAKATLKEFYLDRQTV